MIGSLIETVGGGVAFVFFALLSVGSLYWIWMAIQLGSFAMFVLGIAGPFIIVTAPVGAYSMLFGAPSWLLNFFG